MPAPNNGRVSLRRMSFSLRRYGPCRRIQSAADISLPQLAPARRLFLTFALLFSLAGAFPAQAGPAAAPVFSPAAGTFAGAQSVTITTSSSGATISYTTDGSTPTETNGSTYSSPVAIGSTAMLKAMAYGNGFTDSAVTSGLYTITSSPADAMNVLHDFTSSASEGNTPEAALVQASDGNFYGTTYHGGSASDGTIFRITPAGVLTTMVSFNGTNGGNPFGCTMLQASDGNLYGAAFTGGSGTNGTVFQLTLAGAFTTLASFNGTNGLAPYGLVQGSDSNFYGTTNGGTVNDGTVFQMTPAGALTTLVAFNGTNGSAPNRGPLAQDSAGNFYGMTFGGGSADDGTVFKMTSAGVLTTLVSFTGPNGSHPYAGLVQGSDGSFYGMTFNGGSASDGSIFKITPSGSLTTLVSFNFTNGAGPTGALVQGRDGNFYGTTLVGGSGNDGIVFSMTPAGVITTLVSFDGANGANPNNGLVQGSDGNFYGTAQSGGSSNLGVVFQVIVPPAPGVPALPPWAVVALALLIFSIAAVFLPRGQRT